jgi:hypothetical protein
MDKKKGNSRRAVKDLTAKGAASVKGGAIVQEESLKAGKVDFEYKPQPRPR